MNQILQSELSEKPSGIYPSESLLIKAAALAQLGTWNANLQQNIMQWSEEMYSILGFTPHSIFPSLKIFLSHIHPDDISFFESSFKNNATLPNRLLYRIIDVTGSVKYIKGEHFINTDDQGEIISIAGAALDITSTKMLELELQESRNYYQAIIENSMSAFILTNDNGDIIESNDAACAIFGYTKDEFIKLHRGQIFNENDPKFIPFLEQRKRAGRIKGEFSGYKKNGERIILEFTSTEFLNIHNQLRVISLIIDITSRKYQEETLLKSNERFEQVSKATFDVIWDWDVKAKQLYFGDGFKELFGHEVKNNMGDFSTWYDHIHPEDKERVILSRLNKIVHHTESTWKDEYRYLRANGSVAYISDKGVLLRNSTGTYRMIGAMQDVTELKENEIAINNLNKSLERRAAELAASNEELERFAYVASHDLQEPLRMVSSFLQLLQKKYDHELDETAQKYIHFAVDGADRMKTLILDLLDYSRISADKENHTIINLNDLVSKTMLLLKTLIDECGAEIEVSLLPEVWGNNSQLARLFQNLISNAIKYKSAAKPHIQIGYTENEMEWQFFVKDNGIGIDDKYFEKIFIIFQRLHSKTDFSGTGIGLAICKKIVELHGGRIWVKSELQKGSAFYFTISKLQMKRLEPQMTGNL